MYICNLTPLYLQKREREREREREMGKGRAPCCKKVGLNKGSWTPEEDLRLMAFIHKHGHGNWRALPELAGLLRCGKSCRLRWINYLRPDIKRGNFTKEEEDTIIKLHALLGNKWSKIASCLPGRTDNEIKNVWNTYLKKRLASEECKLSAEKAEDSLNSSSSSTSSSCFDQGESQKREGEQANPSSDSTIFSAETIEILIDEPQMDIWSMLDDTLSTHQQHEHEIEDKSIPAIHFDLHSSKALPLETNTRQSTNNMGVEEAIKDQLMAPDILIMDSEAWNMLNNNLRGAPSLEIGEPEEFTHGNSATVENEAKGEFCNEKEWLEYLEKELGLSSDHQSLLSDAVEQHIVPWVDMEEGQGDPVSSYFLEEPSSASDLPDSRVYIS